MDPARRSLRGRAGERGVTLIEVMIVLFIIAILAVVAIPQFTQYLRKSKTVEATEGLQKIKGGAQAYYEADHYSGDELVPKQFPITTKLTPGGYADCCQEPSAANPRCAPSLDRTAGWGQTGWDALRFMISDAHYYVWRFVSTGTNTGSAYIARAIANFDCDKDRQEFRIIGSVDTEHGVVGKGPVVINAGE